MMSPQGTRCEGQKRDGEENGRDWWDNTFVGTLVNLNRWISITRCARSGVKLSTHKNTHLWAGAIPKVKAELCSTAMLFATRSRRCTDIGKLTMP